MNKFVTKRLLEATDHLDPDQIDKMPEEEWKALEMNARFLGYCDQHGLPETAKSKRKFNNWYYNQKSTNKPAIPHPWFAPHKKIRLRKKRISYRVRE